MQEYQSIPQPPEKPTRRRLGLWLLAPLTVGVIVLIALSLEWKDSLKIQRVVVVGSHILRAQDIYSLANVSKNTPMYEVNIFDVLKRIESQPFVKSVRVNRQIPDALRIEIVEREPIASLSGGQLQYVDAYGVLLPYIQSSVRFDLPMISGIKGVQNVLPGKAVQSNELIQAIDVLQTALAIDSTVYHLISEVKMSDHDEIILYSADGGVPIILGNGEIAKKLVTLQTFWNNFVKTGDADKLRYIDLRYDGQVIVKWNHETESQSTKYSL
jgi:cell division protein FtsQ